MKIGQNWFSENFLLHLIVVGIISAIVFAFLQLKNWIVFCLICNSTFMIFKVFRKIAKKLRKNKKPQKSKSVIAKRKLRNYLKIMITMLSFVVIFVIILGATQPYWFGNIGNLSNPYSIDDYQPPNSSLLLEKSTQHFSIKWSTYGKEIMRTDLKWKKRTFHHNPSSPPHHNPSSSSSPNEKNYKSPICEIGPYGVSMIDYALMSQLAYFKPNSPDFNLLHSSFFQKYSVKKVEGRAFFIELYSKSENLVILSIRGTNYFEFMGLISFFFPFLLLTSLKIGSNASIYT